MRDMKDSGIQWIGPIPVTWNVCKLKYLFADGDNGLKIGPFGSAMKGKTLESGPYKIYNQAHLISNDFSLDRHFVSEETFNELRSYEIKPGDILFSMMGTIGKCQIMPEGFPKGIMDSHLLKAGVKETIRPRFLQYAYDKDYSTQAYSQLLYSSNGTIMNGLNSTILKSVVIALPPIYEQDRIIDYLDKKCSKIDSIIEKQQKLIDKLEEYKLSVITEAVTKGINSNVKMKESGVDYIGRIPLTWEIRPIGSFATVSSSKRVFEESYRDNGVPFYRSKEIGELSRGLETECEIFISEETYELVNESSPAPKRGDMLITSIGSIGNTWISDGRKFYYKDGNLTQISCNDSFMMEYLQYCFNSLVIKEQYNRLAMGSTLLALTIAKIKKMIVVMPSIDEQRVVVEYLDDKCSKIVTEINKRKMLIDKLWEFKKSLIYEVVTGKKEI